MKKQYSKKLKLKTNYRSNQVLLNTHALYNSKHVKRNVRSIEAVATVVEVVVVLNSERQVDSAA